METLSFRYHLSICFDAPVHDHHFTLRCFPISDERQRIDRLQITIYPNEFFSDSFDSFGNRCIVGRAGQPHTRFSADVTGDAVTGLSERVPEGNPWREHLFRQKTRLTWPDEELLSFADSVPTWPSALDTAKAVMEALGKEITYTPGATNIDTTAAEAFSLRKGVCQDYSHIMLSVLREKKIMSRYVVGMLMGEGLSHAWVEVKEGEFWYGFDPTNQLLVTDQHIKISHGRDYCDCRINQGHFYGLGKQTQEISVLVQRKEAQSA
ncbi:MAG: transglutaminase family protein [Lachnospiraceae bacterium]|nr:transglutaminase family protein [Lachnospiraceae bacterium]